MDTKITNPRSVSVPQIMYVRPPGYLRLAVIISLLQLGHVIVAGCGPNTGVTPMTGITFAFVAAITFNNSEQTNRYWNIPVGLLWIRKPSKWGKIKAL